MKAAIVNEKSYQILTPNFWHYFLTFLKYRYSKARWKDVKIVYVFASKHLSGWRAQITLWKEKSLVSFFFIRLCLYRIFARWEFFQGWAWAFLIMMMMCWVTKAFFMKNTSPSCYVYWKEIILHIHFVLFVIKKQFKRRYTYLYIVGKFLNTYIHIPLTSDNFSLWSCLYKNVWQTLHLSNKIRNKTRTSIYLKHLLCNWKRLMWDIL